MATYRVLVDLFLPNQVYVEAGTTISTNDVVPVGWIPPPYSVDPLDSDAALQVWTVGPIGLNDAEPNIQLEPVFFSGMHWQTQIINPSTHPWYRAPGWTRDNPIYFLTGSEALGVRSALIDIHLIGLLPQPYITEDGAFNYTAEDGVSIYVTEQ